MEEDITGDEQITEACGLNSSINETSAAIGTVTFHYYVSIMIGTFTSIIVYLVSFF